MSIRLQPPPAISFSGVLRTQKLRSPLLWQPRWHVLHVNPGVGQNIATHALPTARNVFLLLISAFLVHSFSLFSLCEFSAPGYQRAGTNLELQNFVPYFGCLSKEKLDKWSLPFALQSVLETQTTKCHFTYWDVHSKGKTTTLVLRWDSDNMAAIARPDQRIGEFCTVSQKVTKWTETWRSPRYDQTTATARPRTISQTK